ncbi:MAG: Mur ligase family protein [Candidatus Moranbacteria bacterium]|nr:Mur ligase family protein [Candidatus Moranbacteria bacterium]
MKITNLKQFEDFLKTRIPTREALFVGNIGLMRAKYFMKLLGNPQNKLKVIHIAGTSGKGSTAHLMSHILHSQGFSVGLSISPHVFDIRERMQINNQLPNEKMVLKYFNQILPTILKMEKTKYGMPTFFEINVALAYYMFAQEKLDYAVMETGLGGTLDATNTVTSKNKICVITKIGLDHTEILGNTLAKIAEQKTGIIQKQNTVISHRSAVTALKIINSKCKKQNSKLHIVGSKNYSIISSTPQETVFDFNFQPKHEITLFQNQTTASKWHKADGLKLGLIGLHQAENCSLALACLAILSQRDKFDVDEKSLRKALEKISIPGRLEIRKIKDKTVIIDGAHNPQKMTALTSNLAKIFSQQKFTFVVAFKKGKDFKNMLKKIMPLADKIFLTQFSTSGMDNHWNSIDNIEISKFLKTQKFNNFRIIGHKKSDILKEIKQSKKPVVITGSLYLIASEYSYLQ